MMRELTAALERVGADRAVKAVILRGAGPAFSAGHDLREMLERSVDDYRRIFDAGAADGDDPGDPAAGDRRGRRDRDGGRLPAGRDLRSRGRVDDARSPRRA